MLRVFMALMLIASQVSPAYGDTVTIASAFGRNEYIRVWAQDLSKCITENSGFDTKIIDFPNYNSPEQIGYAVKKGFVDIALVPFHSLPGAFLPLDTILRLRDTLAEDNQNNMQMSKLDSYTKSLGVHTMAIGWQYAALILNKRGSHLVESESIPSMKFLKGKSVAVNDPFLRKFVAQAGAKTIITNNKSSFYQFSMGNVDGAVIGQRYLNTKGIPKFVKGILVGSPENLFGRPIAVVANATTVKLIGSKLFHRMRYLCREAGQGYEEKALQSVTNLLKQAEAIGLLVLKKEDLGKK